MALLLVGCSLGDLDLENRPCPCIDGWVCSSSNICVRADGGLDDGSAPDADLSDAPSLDSKVVADARDDATTIDTGMPCEPSAEICNGVDDDCDGSIDEELGIGLGDECSVGVGECEVIGALVCDGPDRVACGAAALQPQMEVCNTLDDNCDGDVDEAGCASATVYPSCKAAFEAGEASDGTYLLLPEAGADVAAVYCDMTTDGGGWTLVASTQTTTLNDQASDYYPDLSTLAPRAGHEGVWDGLRGLSTRFDVRFTCRDSVGAADDAMRVDLSFYDVIWYGEWTTGIDSDSCFSESDGVGADPPPARMDNLAGMSLPAGDVWTAAAYLEGEDGCDDTGDFTVDFDDRGMDSNEGDGTDWGEDDNERKCGDSNLPSGQWFIFAREL